MGTKIREKESEKVPILASFFCEAIWIILIIFGRWKKNTMDIFR